MKQQRPLGITYEDSGAMPRPDWVMCGVPLPNGWVRLLASRELNQAQLAAEFERAQVVDDGDLLPTWGPLVQQRIALTTEMRTFTVIDAPDYPTAFRELFKDWTPGPAGHPAVTEGPRGISA